MSKQQFVLEATSRATVGKGASRRLRRKEGVLPGILYGGDKAPTNISISHKDLAYVLENEAFFTSIITMSPMNHRKESLTNIGTITATTNTSTNARWPINRRVNCRGAVPRWG